MATERFSFAQVTPHAWEQHHEVNRFVERLSDELCGRGHRVVVIAPSESRDLVQSSRDAARRLAEDPEALFADEGCASVFGIGQSTSLASARPRRSRSVSLDVSRTVEKVVEGAPFDFVHVHDPFAPSLSSAALRHSLSLNVGTFHAASPRSLSTPPARRLVELLFGRLDGRTTSFAATRDVVTRFYPGDYRVIRPGADLVERPAEGETEAETRTVEIFYSIEEERAALRLVLRALRRLPEERAWRATIWSRAPGTDSALGQPQLGRALRDRVRFVDASEGSEAQYLSRADVAVAASSGARPAPQLVLRTLAAGAVPVAARLPEYEECLREGELGLLFEPRDADTMAAQLTRLVEDESLRERLHARIAARHDELDWSRTADEFEDLYAEIAGRRHSPGDPAVRKRLSAREYVHVDVHMHTDHSPDCATPVETLLEAARTAGLQAIAITDHNEISGALEARERALRDGGDLEVILAEEVKTADQGEVIGLFIEELIPRGMTLEETIAEIHRQGGLAYVPHPFDRMHSVPDYEHLLAVVEQIDAIEVFNPRIAVSTFNAEAVRFAAKYRIAAGAGSDSHVAQGLGSVKIRMRSFDGPEEFLESLRDADIVRSRQSLLYVQALKFLQTKTRPSRGRGEEREGEESESTDQPGNK